MFFASSSTLAVFESVDIIVLRPLCLFTCFLLWLQLWLLVDSTGKISCGGARVCGLGLTYMGG